MPTAVSNSSPLIHLAKIGQLALLHQQFQEILVPPAVWQESVIEGGNLPDAQAIAQAGWITQQEVQECPLLVELRTDLHEGEAQTIALGLQVKADWVLLDEHEARRVAKVHGLRTVGAVGVLLKAFAAGRLASFEPCLDALEASGFRMSQALREQALDAASRFLKR